MIAARIEFVKGFETGEADDKRKVLKTKEIKCVSAGVSHHKRNYGDTRWR